MGYGLLYKLGRKCPNGCGGQLAMQHCKGHNGYPVTHFWRHYEDKVFFIGKGYHDHPRPEVKLSSEKRRAYTKVSISPLSWNSGDQANIMAILMGIFIRQTAPTIGSMVSDGIIIAVMFLYMIYSYTV